MTRSTERPRRLAVAVGTAALLALSAATAARADEWVRPCTGPSDAFCTEPVQVKERGEADSAYAEDPDLLALGQPGAGQSWNNPRLGRNYTIQLLRPVNRWSGVRYEGARRCKWWAQGGNQHLGLFVGPSDFGEVYCRELGAATRTEAPGSPEPHVVQSLAGRTARVRVRLGDFNPRYGLLVGSAQGDLAESTTPNRTWKIETVGGKRYLTVVFNPLERDGLFDSFTIPQLPNLVLDRPCQGECNSAQRANWRGIYTYAFFSDLTGFDHPALGAGLTVITDAMRFGRLKVDAQSRVIGVQLVGPHLREDGSRNQAFASIFIPASLAKSPLGLGLPLNNTDLEERLKAYRDGAPALRYDARITGPAGAPTGVYGRVDGVTFSAPTYEFRGPARVARPKPPRKPDATTSVNRKRRIFSALIAAEAGVAYSISATRDGSAAPRAGRCAPEGAGRKVRCSVKLARGRWTVSILPLRGKLKGPELSTSLVLE